MKNIFKSINKKAKIEKAKQSDSYCEIIIIGAKNVGKATLLEKYKKKKLDDSDKEDVEGPSTTKTCKLPNKKVYDLFLLTKTIEKINPAYYDIIESNIAIFTYDISKRETFDFLKQYLAMIEVKKEMKNKPSNFYYLIILIVFAIVGTKLDLIENEAVTVKEAKELAKKYNAYFKIVSSEINFGVKELFVGLVEKYDKLCFSPSNNSMTKVIQSPKPSNPINNILGGKQINLEIEEWKKRLQLKGKGIKENAIMMENITNAYTMKEKRSLIYVHEILPSSTLAPGNNIPNSNIIKRKIKAVFIGEEGVGKTNIINRIIDDNYEDEINQSFQINCLTKDLSFKNDSKTFKYSIDIWETNCPYERRSLLRAFYKDADIVFLVYSVLKKDTFNDIKVYWLQSIKDNAEKKQSNIYIYFNFSYLLNWLKMGFIH